MNAAKFQADFDDIVDILDAAARENACTTHHSPADTWEGIHQIIASADMLVTDWMDARSAERPHWVLTQAQASRVLDAVKARYGWHNRPKVTPVVRETRRRSMDDTSFAAAKRLRTIMVDRSGDDDWASVPLANLLQFLDASNDPEKAADAIEKDSYEPDHLRTRT